MIKWRQKWQVLGLALAFVLASCAEEADEAAPSPPVTLKFGNGAEPKTLDPTLSTLVAEDIIISALFQGLTDLDPAGQIIPGQAESWVISSDGLSYTFHLREALKWSDGSPLTAEDFVYSLRRVIDPETAAEFASFYFPIRNAREVHEGRLPVAELGVRALSPTRLRVELVQPKPSLIELFSHSSAKPVPRAAIAAHGAEWTQPGNMISNGAYQLAEWEVERRIAVIRNPHFHAAGEVVLPRIHFYPIEQEELALEMFAAGDLDIARGFPLDRLDWIREALPDTIRIEPQFGVYFFVINTTRPPFDDARVRRALSMAVDRDAIVRTIMADIGAEAAYSFVPPRLPSYETIEPPFWAELPLAERRRMAASLLAVAGITPETPLEVPLIFNIQQENRRIALAVAEMWEPLGIRVVLESNPFRIHDDKLKTGAFTIGRRGWVSTFDSPEYFLTLLSSEAVPLNAGRYSNPTYDALLNQALTLPGVAERAALMRRAEEIAMGDIPVIPIYFYVNRYLVQPRVLNWVENPTGRHRVRFLAIEAEG